MEDYKIKATIVAGFDAQQAKKDLNSFRDDIKATQDRLKSDKGIVLASNLAELRIKAKELATELKKTTQEDRKLDIQTNIELVKKQITDANRQFTNFIRTGDEAQSVLGKNFNEIGKSIDNGTGKLEGFDNLLAGLGITAGINNLAKGIINVAASFERYDSILTNALGSQQKATQSFELLKEISAETPFSLDQITQSYIKLVNRGFIPTKKEITNLGDLASSQGKSFDQLVEAVLDAQTGEFERLKEFGVRAKVSGDQVALTFKGVTTTVSKTDEAIKNYLLGLGELQGIQGAMATQSATFNGAISNLGDAFTNLGATIGSVFLPILTPLIRIVSEITTEFNKLLETSPTLAKVVGVVTGAIVLLVTGLGGYLLLAPFITAANVAILGSFLALAAPILAVAAVLGVLAVAYDKNFLGFRDFVNNTLNDVRVLYEFLRIIFNNIKGLFDGLSTYISTVIGDIKSAFGGMSVISSIVGKIFSNVFNVIKGYVAPILNLVNSIIKAVGQIPGVQATLVKARNNVAQQTTAGLGITSPAKYNPFDLSETSLPTAPRVSKGGGGGGSRAGKSEAVKAEEERLKAETQAQKKAFDEKSKNAKTYIDKFKETIKSGEKSIDDLTGKIKSANDEIKKLQDAQLSEQDKLAAKYVEIQAKIANPGEGDDIAKLQADLELINQFTTEAQRKEALRYSTLTDVQKIVEEIQSLQAQQKTKEEQVKELEKQKETEQVILDQFNLQREALEKKYTALVNAESQTRMNILQREIDRTKELIKLQQKAGTSASNAIAGSNSNTTNNASTTNNVAINVNGTNSPDAVARQIAQQLQNFNSGNNK